MADQFQVPEKQFLTQLAVREHNFQTGSNVDWKNTVIYSVPPAPGFTHGWEINRTDFNDTLRIHLCINVELTDSVGPYNLEVKSNFRPGQLGDEVFVYRGSVDVAHTLYRGYKFAWIDLDYEEYPMLIQTDGSPILKVDGGFLALV